MHLAVLTVDDFRSYERAELRLVPGVSTLLGRNGQGKTNLLEAIGYLSTLSSHRVATDAPLVRRGAARAVVAGQVVRAGRTATLDVEIVPGRVNKARVNRSPVPRPSEILGMLRTVLFAPEDLALVKGDPSDRRRFVDDLLSSRAPRFAGVRADYERVLRQRTALLRSAAAVRRSGGGRTPPEGMLATLAVWDEQLAATGAELMAGRVGLLSDLEDGVRDIYAELAAVSTSADGASWWFRSSVRSALRAEAEHASGGWPVDALPATAEAWREEILEALAQVRGDELDRGVCLVGPHRDDLVLGICDLPAKGYASQGECWSLALAMRLASYDLLEEDQRLGSQDGSPVLLLDDVFAELDDRRRDHLVARVRDAEQVLVTAAVADDVPPELQGNRYEVEDGMVRPASSRVPR